MTLRDRPRPYRLRRGVPVLPRAHGLVQVGTDPDRRVLVPASPAVAQLLGQLVHGAPECSDPELRRLLARLVANGLVLDEPEQAHRRRSRTETRTRLVGPSQWCGELAVLLGHHDLTEVTAAADPPSDLTVLLSAGEPSRELVDTLTYTGEALLLVATIDARVRLGPFVLPGSTACLRCVDAHLTVRDPARPPYPEPVHPEAVELSPLLVRHVLLRAVAEVATWAEGRLPRSSSATTWIDEDLVEERQEWARHPHCGCSWGDLLVAR